MRTSQPSTQLAKSAGSGAASLHRISAASLLGLSTSRALLPRQVFLMQPASQQMGVCHSVPGPVASSSAQTTERSQRVSAHSVPGPFAVSLRQDATSSGSHFLEADRQSAGWVGAGPNSRTRPSCLPTRTTARQPFWRAAPYLSKLQIIPVPRKL